MFELNPKYVVRKIVDTDQYVVDALWSDGGHQQLIGVFTLEISAERIAKKFRDNDPTISPARESS